MDHVKNMNLYGVEFRQKTCIPGKGAPTSATEGAVGEFYMDTDTGTVYKCTAAGDKTWTWKDLGSGNGSGDAVLYTLQTLTEEQKAQARENIGAATVDEVIAALPKYNGEVEDA